MYMIYYNVYLLSLDGETINKDNDNDTKNAVKIRPAAELNNIWISEPVKFFTKVIEIKFETSNTYPL